MSKQKEGKKQQRDKQTCCVCGKPAKRRITLPSKNWQGKTVIQTYLYCLACWKKE